MSRTLGLGLALLAGQAHAVRYVFYDCGAYEYGTSKDATTSGALNDLGTVVGAAGNTSFPFRWTAETGMRRLGPSQRLNQGGWANAVNNSGTVVGWMRWYDPVTKYTWGHLPMVWTPAGGFRQIPRIDGPVGMGEAFDVNSSGMVCGDCQAYNQQAFVWTEERGTEGIGWLSPPLGSRATSVNDSGVVVGSALVGVWPIGTGHAFRWTRGTGMEDLGVPLGYESAAATHVSADGTVYGIAHGFNDIWGWRLRPGGRWRSWGG